LRRPPRLGYKSISVPAQKDPKTLTPDDRSRLPETAELTRRAFLEIASLAGASFAISGCGLAARLKPYQPIETGKATHEYLCATDASAMLQPPQSIYDDAALASLTESDLPADIGQTSETAALMRKRVALDISRCIGCGQCLMVCPVVEATNLTPVVLNRVAQSGNMPADAASVATLKSFIFGCFQCGRCNEVCPQGASRQRMTMWSRSRILDDTPIQYDRLIKWRGPNAGLDAAIIKRFLALSRVSDRRLLGALDRKTFRRADTALYFGCYALGSPELCHALMCLHDKLGLDYEVVAGFEWCCGEPMGLAGRFDEYDRLNRNLFENAFGQIQPKRVITGCAECNAALLHQQKFYGAKFEVVYSSAWVREHLADFKLKPTEMPVALHDACKAGRLPADGYFPAPAMYEEPREVIRAFGKLKEMAHNRENANCCGDTASGADRESTLEASANVLDEARAAGAQLLVTECAGCYERFGGFQRKTGHPVRVVELAAFVHDKVAIDCPYTRA
jgi:Fe-S oxidoreductase